MLSINTIKSGSQEKEEYYTEDESLADEPENYYADEETPSPSNPLTRSQWHGKGAIALGLEGEVQREDFKAVFYGSKPDSVERIRWDKQNPEDQERLAEDFTFSAPKSVAIALHLNGDHRLHEAHLEAVRETLDLIEKRYATTRIQANGNRQLVQTGNLAIALINHHTSRSKDMQLHTHAVIMNGTQGPDGKWRSLQNDAMSEQGTMGHIYRQKLALKVQALGYEIYETKDAFELKGLSREDIEVFSKRTAAIARELERQGLEATSENKARAVLTSRRAKDRTQTLEELQQSWKAEAELSGIEAPQPEPAAVNPLRLGTARAELDSAIAHLSERSAAFSREELYRTVFSHIQAFEVADLDREIAQHPELVKTKDARLTTVAALKRESATVREWFKGQGQAQAIAAHEKAMSELKGTGLNAGQAEAIAGVLAATDQHLIVHGLSGVGKTTALRELKHQIEQSGQPIEIKGFSPTIEAAEVLKASLGIEAATVESLIRSKPSSRANQLWIVDEAGMVSADQQLAMLQQANAVGARILLVGDPKQNPSVKAGSPMRSLIAHGATTFRIADIIRQQNAVQKQAVELIANDRPQDALSLLVEHDYVQQIGDRSQRVNAIAADYLSLTDKERSQTLIVTGTNAERKAIVAEIRTGLKAEGRLGNDHEVMQLSSRYLTQEQKRRIESYRQGDYIQLLRDYRSTALQARKLYRVMGRSGNELVVASEGGRLYRFDPSKYAEKEVFSTEQAVIATGDRLRWTATNRAAGQVNGREFEVMAIKGDSMTIRDAKGELMGVDLTQPLPIDNAMVATAYRAQGRTAKRVIVSATNNPTSAREPFYVEVSRQTHFLKVYAQDLERLHQWVNRSVTQANPIELIGEPQHYENRRNDDLNGRDRLHPSGLTGTESPERSTPGTESGSEDVTQRSDEHDSHRRAQRDAGLSRPIHRDVGESGTVADRRGDPRIGRGTQGSQAEDFGLGIDSRGYERPGELRSGGDSQLRNAPIQQPTERPDSADRTHRTDNPAVERHVYQGMEQAISALDNLFDSERVRLSEITAELGELASQLQQVIPVIRQPAQSYRNLDKVVEAIAAEPNEAEVLDILDATQSLLHDLNRHIETTLQRGKTEAIGQAIQSWREYQQSQPYKMERAAELVGEWQDEQNVSALIPEIQAIAESLQAQEPKPYNMQRVTELVREWQDEQNVSALLPEVQSIIESLQAQQPQQYDMEQATELVQQWQEERDISTLVPEIQAIVESLTQRQLPHQYDNLDSAIASLDAHEDQEILEASDLIDDLRSLADELSNRLTPPTPLQRIPHQYRNMEKAAALCAEIRAEDVINHHLADFNELASQWVEVLRSTPELKDLAATVQGFRDSLVEANAAIDDRAKRIAEELEKLEMSTTPKPHKPQPFWQPQYPDTPPNHIQPHHWDEFKRSAIHPDLIAANVESISGREVYERLLSDRLSAMGSGQFVTASMSREMEKYAQVAEGGWWAKAGIDAQSLTFIQAGQQPFESTWGCFKPDNPRMDAEKSERKGHPVPIKYEHPAKTSRRIYLPIVPDSLANRIYEKHGIKPTPVEKASGFWYIVKQYNLPITITEGFKKTCASLSQGEVTIGVSGVNGIYRSNDSFGNRLPERQLNEDIAVFTEAAKQLETFATPGREFRFAYDKDDNPNTVRNVWRDLVRGVELLQAKGCTCKVVQWEGDKGLDDLIVNQGALAYTKAQARAVSAEAEVRQYYRYQYQVIANQFRMSDPLISNERLDCEVYLRASEKGDIKDAVRFVSQSDEARRRWEESPAAGLQYIQAIIRASQVYEGAKRQKRKDIDEIIRRIVVHQAIVPQQNMKREIEKKWQL